MRMVFIIVVTYFIIIDLIIITQEKQRAEGKNTQTISQIKKEKDEDRYTTASTYALQERRKKNGKKKIQERK